MRKVNCCLLFASIVACLLFASCNSSTEAAESPDSHIATTGNAYYIERSDKKPLRLAISPEGLDLLKTIEKSENDLNALSDGLALANLGRILSVDQRTPVEIVEIQSSTMKVRLLVGYHKGRVGWLPLEFVKKGETLGGFSPNGEKSTPTDYAYQVNRDNGRRTYLFPIQELEKKAIRAEDAKGPIRDIDALVGRGNAILIPNGTPVETIEATLSSRNVRILDGEHKGKTGWITAGFIKINPTTDKLF